MFDFIKTALGKNSGSSPDGAKENPSSSEKNKVKNWYDEKYDRAVTQRNFLLIASFFFLILSLVSVVAVTIIVSSKEYDPFVIQIDESTGAAKVVEPVLDNILDANDSLARYFIRKYVEARETYNPVNFDTQARETIRLFSSSFVYWQYMGYIKNKANDPTILYGQNNTTFMMVRSWSKLDGTKKFMLRFSINETLGQKRILNKIAIIEFDYLPLELTDKERSVNPVGFQVKGYRVDDDNS